MLKLLPSILLAVTVLLIGVVIWTVSVADRRPIAWTNEDYTIALIGNKMAEDGQRGHARNVWDLQLYQGKVYVGGGSTTQNTGPINVWAYDPATGQFDREFVVQEEAIEVYRVLDGDLYIPAADPVKGDSNKFYRRRNGTWTNFSGGPDLAHVRDIALYQGQLIGVGNARQIETHTSAFVSHDRGRSFSPATDPKRLNIADNWFYSLFDYQGTLFATSLRFHVMGDLASLLTFNDQSNHFSLDAGYTTADFLPVTGDQAYAAVTMRLWTHVEYKGLLVYAIRTYSTARPRYHEMYNRSYGMFIKEGTKSSPQPVVFPDDRVVGEDVIVRNDSLFVLANRFAEKGHYVVYVYRLTDPQRHRDPNWDQIVKFNCRNKARSFELMNDTFYFGLGCEFDEPVAHAGEIVTVTRSSAADRSNN